MKKKLPARKAAKPKAKAAAKSAKVYSMRLYVSGATPRSTTAITNLRKLCEEHLSGKYELQVIDLYQEPEKAKEGMVIAAPTLVKSFPLPLRRFIGDLSDKQNLMRGLEIDPAAVAPPPTKRPPKHK